MPDLNPFDEPVMRAKATYATLTERKSAIAKELEWFDARAEESLRQRLNSCAGELDGLRRQLTSNNEELALLQSKHDETAKRIGTALNPRNWFASDQVQLRKTKTAYSHQILSLHAKGRKFSEQIRSTEGAIKAAKDELNRFLKFDATGQREALVATEGQIESLLARVKIIITRKKEVDEALEPVVAQMRQYSDLIQKWTQRRDQATSLDRQLTNADNSYARAMVHEQCERQFNVGRPRQVIVQCEKEIRRISRDYEKASRRAAEIGRKAARRIDAIIIDGNNLCYDNGSFIGLSALDALVPLLRNDYSVTIVFDSAIRRMLQASNQDLSSHFGDSVRVHVVAAGATADQTLLDVAGKDKHSYVISNDRFGEFNDKEVVRANRVIRHEILNQRILIHDLGIDARF